MTNPFDAIGHDIKAFVQSKVDEAKLEVHIALLEETASVALSRLATLNPDVNRQADYAGALRVLQGRT